MPRTPFNPRQMEGDKGGTNRVRIIAATLGLIISFSIPDDLAAQVPQSVVREQSAPEVYAVTLNPLRRIWVPTPDALFAMGYDWSQVEVVADGSLNGLTRINIPSASPTPGSLVYPPDHGKYFPLHAVPNAVTVYSQGREVQIAELYGWLWLVDGECGDGEDFWYLLEVDPDWADAQGVDLNRLLRVGNVARIGKSMPGATPRRAVAMPVIDVELNSAGRNWTGGVGPRPSDWVHVGNCNLTFPFDPYRPDGTNQLSPMDSNLGDNRGPYVRISGSLVTDSPHEAEGWIPRYLSQWFGITPNADAEWRGSVDQWHPGVSSDSEQHYARWTEIHPPDLIQVLPWKEPRVTTRAIALNARPGATPGPVVPSCESVNVDLYPDVSRPPNTRIAFQELRGPETYWPWGENADNGSWVTRFDGHINVRAQVCGGPLFGSPGRFKAIYRIWWETATAQEPSEQCRQRCEASRQTCIQGCPTPRCYPACTSVYDRCVENC